MALSEEVMDEYKTSLADLNFNSKPLINMLTMLAEDHEQHAPEIVKVIEDHINKCKRERKLAALYLMDSIMKNLEKSSYRSLFSKNVVQTFTSVFEQVDEKTRASMFKLRQTWSTMLPNATLYRIDKKIKSLLDPAWPITATEPEQTSIHVNPRFLQGQSSESERSSPEVIEDPPDDSEDQEMLMRKQLIAKQQELLSLKQARLELELVEAAEKLRKKRGSKTHSTSTTSSSALALPLPSFEDSLPLPDTPVKPRDPRSRPSDPRLRDPRLQTQDVSSASVHSSVTGSVPPSVSLPAYGTSSVPVIPGSSSIIGSPPPVASVSGYGITPNTSSVPMIPDSSQSSFPRDQLPPPGVPIPQYSIAGQGMPPFSGLGTSVGDMPHYNGLQGDGMPYPPAMDIHHNVAHSSGPPIQVFSGEVFAQEESAKFSDGTDSDSSRSSIQDLNTNSSCLPQSNIRDPRHRTDHKTNYYSNRVEQRTESYERQRNHNKQVKNRPGEKQVSEITSSRGYAKDTRIGHREKQMQQNRKSKERDVNIPSMQAKDGMSQSHHKSTSGLQAQTRRSLSKERESKSDTKLNTSDAERKKKEQERTKPEIKGSRKVEVEEKKLEKPRNRASRERECSKSPKQYSSKTRDANHAGDKAGRTCDEKKDVQTESTANETTSNNKKCIKNNDKKTDINSVPPSKETTNNENSEMDIDVRVRKEPEKRPNSAEEDTERVIKKPKLEIEEKPFPEGTSDINERVSNVDVTEEAMDVEHGPVPELEVPTIDDDISDLFGGEDEDYRPAVLKQQLPLKSPSSKGWDQYKASQPDQYAYDIELKKMRQDSVTEGTPAPEEEPQDEDLRVGQPEYQRQMSGVNTMEIPKEFSMNQHAKILLRAHKELKEGRINHDQHQDLLKQLGTLMQIQQLQEQNRRLSNELFQTNDQVSDSDIREQNHSLSRDMIQPTEQVSDRDLREQNRTLSSGNLQGRSPPRLTDQDIPVGEPIDAVRSPERPLDSFKIPKKNREVIDDNDRQTELSNLYPGSPQEVHFSPFSVREDSRHNKGAPQEVIYSPYSVREDSSMHSKDARPESGDIDEIRVPFQEHTWQEDSDGRRQTGDNFVGQGPPPHRPDSDVLPNSQDVFEGPPEHRGPRRGEYDRRGPPEHRRAQHRERDIEHFPENRGDGQDGPPENIEGRRPREMEFDRQGPPDRFNDAPNTRESRGLYRDELDRRSDEWKEDQHWSDKRGPDGPPNQRGQRHRGRGRDFDRRGRDKGPEIFNGPLDRSDLKEEGSKRPDDPEWRDSRRPDNWRNSDDRKHQEYDERSSQDRFPDKRGPPGRFRDGQNVNQRESNGSNNISPFERDPPEKPRGREQPGPADKLKSVDPTSQRAWKDKYKPIEDWEIGPQSWNDLKKPRGPQEPAGRSSNSDSRKAEGQYGRPGTSDDNQGSSHLVPPETRRDGSKKELHRGSQHKGAAKEKQRSHGPQRSGHKGKDRFDSKEYEPASIEKSKPKPLKSILDPISFGPRGGPTVVPREPPAEDPRMQEPGSRPENPTGMNRPPGPFPIQVDSYIDKFGDPRFRCFADMGPVVSEEVVIGKKNFEIKLGAPPRKIAWGKDIITVSADPSKRGVVVDGQLIYKFGERVKDVTIGGRKEKLFYHGRPLSMWIDGQHYEVRVDAPPKALNINGKQHRVQIDGRDMMSLIDKEEKGRFGGEPRFVFIDEERMELRFDPPPRHILIDGNLCELKLNMQQPCVNIKGVFHGIRFDGPPRDIFVNGNLYQIFADHAVKLRVGHRFHYVALGGPCHELIVDGKWFEMKFSEPPKEVNVGNIVLMVQLPGAPPEVKILPEIAQEPRPIPPGMQGSMPPPGMPMQRPGHVGFPGPRGPPNMPTRPGMPMPGMIPPGMRPMHPLPGPMPLSGPMQPLPLNMPPSTGAPHGGPSMVPGMGPALSVAGTPAMQQNNMPNVLSSLFTQMPPTSGAPAAPIDITSLLAKLVNTGIIKKEQPDIKPDIDSKSVVKQDVVKTEVVKPAEYILPQKKPPKEEKFLDMPDMREMNTNEMKSLPVGMIQRLYSGVQCTSCGERFALKDGEKTEHYRQHLDWHFRQNRKDKADMKVTSCRRWYYGIEDWIQYQEIVDSEDTGKSNFFEQQQPTDVTQTATQNPLTLVVPEGVSVIKCPPATGKDNEDLCNICHEVFEHYWDEELEEWHLREAIKVNNKTYHPICYEDHTDVSEGTPSPSVLSSVELGYNSRKSLTYDESSQDDHHTSFEEERKISNITEPMDSTENHTVTESDSVSVKLEPLVEVSVKIEPVEVSVKIEPVETVDIKQEPVAEDMETEYSVSHDNTDGHISSSQEIDSLAITNIHEPPEDPKDLPESHTDKPTLPNDELNSEIVDSNLGQKSVAEVSEKDTEVSMETERENSTLSKQDSEVSMETENKTVISATEIVSKSVMPVIETDESIEETHSDCGKLDESQEAEESQAAESEKLDMETDSQDKTIIEMTTSHIHVDICETKLAPPDDNDVSSTQHSPTYSMLNKVKLAEPVELDINPEVLEMGSNASTPTRDELPSPPT